MREYHNLVPEMARVGIQLWQVTNGVLLRGREEGKEGAPPSLSNSDSQGGAASPRPSPLSPTRPMLAH